MKTSSEIQLTGRLHYVMCWQKQGGGELEFKGRNLPVCCRANKIYHITAPVTCQSSNVFSEVVSLFEEGFIFSQIRGHVQVVKYLPKVVPDLFWELNKKKLKCQCVRFFRIQLGLTIRIFYTENFRSSIAVANRL